MSPGEGEPSSKKAKYDETIPIPKYVMNITCDDFSDIRLLPAFVDKTLLIKDVIESLPKILLVAPRKFGKSINISMLRRFFEKPRNEAEAEKQKELFKDLAISNYPEIMEHMGKYPVIFLNYRSPGTITSYDDAFRLLRRVVHYAFKNHSYLSECELKSNDKEFINSWCDETQFKVIATSDDDIFSALEFLSRKLYEHYHEKPIVIADEYDSICSDAIVGITRDDAIGFDMRSLETTIKNIISLSVGSLSCLLRYNKFVDRGVLTGISYLATIGLSRLGSVKVYKFQESTKFSKYFGITTQECSSLLKKFHLNSKKDAIIKNYNGYRDNMMNILSIMRFLNEKNISSYWKGAGIVANLEHSMNLPAVRSKIIRLLSDMENDIEVDYPIAMDYRNIIHLKAILDGEDIDIEDVQILLIFLTERGCFKIADLNEKERKVKLKIPNLVIKNEFHRKLNNYYTVKMKINMEYVKYCVSLFEKLNASEDDNIRTFHKISTSLNEIINAVKFETKNEAVVHHLVFFIIFQSTKYKCFSEVRAAIKHFKRLDILLLSATVGIVIELQYEKSSDIALRQILDNKYHEAFNNLTYNPEQTKLEYFILIGLNMSKKQDVTLSVLLNNLDFEKTLHF